MKLLILGGTTEAAALADRLADRSDLDVTLSLAGRTSRPKPAPVPTRVGGFGGAEGLQAWIEASGIDAVIDATHPFAAVISRNAAAACAALGRPLLALRRPPWTAAERDRWIEVADMEDAVAALGETPRRVFLTIGRLDLAPFAAAPWHRYVVRTIEPIGDALPGPGGGDHPGSRPFDEAQECALMRAHGVDILVTKHSGGAATYGKIAAARALGIPVVMVERPAKPAVPNVGSVNEALAWIEAHRTPHSCAASTHRASRRRLAQRAVWCLLR
jgi:precorrin-6A/cobalt-precorrin-6A reductase